MPAKKSLLRVKSKKKPKSNEQTNKLVNQKYIGRDPIVKPVMSVVERAQFYTWCSYMADLSLCRQWLDEYLKPGGRSTRGVPDTWINRTVCYRARLRTLGVAFSDSQLESFETGVEEVLRRVSVEPEVTAPRPSIQDNVREKFSEVMGELEGMLDDGIPEDFSIEKWMREKSVSPTIASRIVKKLKAVLDELIDASTGKDPQLVEGYSRLNRKQLNALIQTYIRLVDPIERMLSNDRKARAPRKTKPVSVEKKLKHLVEVYQKYSKEWNIY